ncbi:CBS domain-containing protein [Azospirillum sp. RWY-5-1]|uniref:CBS domain-containing protein n=1 Tax=Azospirillum oleiclasticum TaxID=2735135 RepID=A0ABX2TE40_9PROT|nr:CBS domain-containing protein [Azospirillum oleiclasticum]NYZ14682.1 CBS domain-containing protein [Azospirillum oleiclasticum]NYZ22332.1 CBS domain-containing protein [Azospirillum oleiclasticum]
MPNRKLIPDVITGQDLVCMAPGTPVRDAVRMMAEKRIGAILVMENGSLKGIFTERDVTVRVVAAGLDAERTALEEVMTAAPDTLPPDAKAIEALSLMEERRYRHLPVVAADGTVKGIVSIRDLFAVVRLSLEEEIKTREEFMFGSGYSAGVA